jgi:hypothetical protein
MNENNTLYGIDKDLFLKYFTKKKSLWKREKYIAKFKNSNGDIITYTITRKKFVRYQPGCYDCYDDEALNYLKQDIINHENYVRRVEEKRKSMEKNREKHQSDFEELSSLFEKEKTHSKKLSGAISECNKKVGMLSKSQISAKITPSRPSPNRHYTDCRFGETHE